MVIIISIAESVSSAFLQLPLLNCVTDAPTVVRQLALNGNELENWNLPPAEDIRYFTVLQPHHEFSSFSIIDTKEVDMNDTSSESVIDDFPDALNAPPATKWGELRLSKGVKSQPYCPTSLPGLLSLFFLFSYMMFTL